MSDVTACDVAPFLRGVAFAGVRDLPYPRALPSDAARLPADTWAMAGIPVGVRLELVGDAEVIEVDYHAASADVTNFGSAASTSFRAWSGDTVVGEAAASTGTGTAMLPGPAQLPTDGSGGGRLVVYLPEGMRPTITAVRGVGGSIEAAPALPRWVCYGDSIAAGWGASEPARAWPAAAARSFGLDVVNLGYAGAARGEVVSAEHVAALDAEVICLAYGTNCWSRIAHSAAMVAAGLDAFLDIIRSRHADTPVVVASPVIRPDAEQTANLLGATLVDLRVAIETVVRHRTVDGDERLSLVRGGDLLQATHLADGVHPDDAGHEVLRAVFGGAVRDALVSTGAAAPTERGAG
jgi:lysophospholipase L1-like esterase